MNPILVNLLAVAVIVFIVAWFWLIKPKSRAAEDTGPIDITVDGGVYSPSSIEVPAGQPVTLRFIRKDPNPCAEKVIFDDLDVSDDLEVDRPKAITVTPPQPGTYEFTCQMGMYRGQLVVR